MKFTIWHSSESFARYLIDHTALSRHSCDLKRLPESDASDAASFHSVPDHLKKVLYLDCPDIVIEKNNEPVLSIEISTEAGTGHNVFQRFSRLAAAVENGIPSFYVYPEAVLISRKVKKGGTQDCKWDALNPLIFLALEGLMRIFEQPAFLFFFPSHYPDKPRNAVVHKGLKYASGNWLACPEPSGEMENLFACINRLLQAVDEGNRSSLLNCREFQEWRNRQLFYYSNHSNGKSPERMSPLTAVRELPTEQVVSYIRKTSGVERVEGLLQSRAKTMVYQVNAKKFRSDPYPGALAAIDYLRCRWGRTFEDREFNLVLAWGKLDVSDEGIRLSGNQSIESFCKAVKQLEKRSLLGKTYSDLCAKKAIPRYYMQVRYGSMFSRSKQIRVFSYFSDAILFPDGALWREG